MAGKKHNEKLQAYLEKKRVAECSIFVKGFPPRTEENELVLYFQNFGPINKIVMETHEKKKVHVFVMFASIINLCLHINEDRSCNKKKHFQTIIE